MNILLLGAGAVGVAYARHLQLAGAKICFHVRPKYRAEVEKGLITYPLNEKPDWTPVPFNGYEVTSELDEIRGRSWDQVWLCVSSTAIRRPWLDPFLEAVGEAVIVALQPGLEDQELLLSKVPAERLVWGIITLISYQAPLPTETVEPGFAYWFPPLQKNPFGGPKEATKPVVDLLKKGGCPTKASYDKLPSAALPGAVLMPYLVALEGADWSFSKIRTGDWLSMGSKAAKEAVAVAGRHVGQRPWFRGALCPLTMRFILGMAPKVIPFDIETYLKYHFTKVGDQTQAAIERYRKLGEQYDLPTSALAELSKRVFEKADASSGSAANS